MRGERRSITINDVAADAGVSRSTVSLVLRGSSRIPAATKIRVEKSIRRLGYTYNRTAASLRSQSSQTVGLMINDVANPFFAEVTAGIERAVDETGMMLYLVDSSEDIARQSRLLNSLQEHGVAGLVVCPATGSSASVFTQLVATGMPLCIGVRPLDVPGADFAGPDHREAAELAVQHLIDRDHRDIAFVGGETGNPAYTERLSGYSTTLTKHGLEFDKSRVFERRPGSDAAHPSVEKILSLSPRPTAILCYNDSIAIAVLHVLRQHGLAPGRDIAVVGIDGIATAELASPPLTTVSLDPRQIGEESIRLVMARIAAPKRSPSRVVLKPRLIVRESTTTYQG